VPAATTRDLDLALVFKTIQQGLDLRRFSFRVRVARDRVVEVGIRLAQARQKGRQAIGSSGVSSKLHVVTEGVTVKRSAID
jgi:hypothetical protein